MRFLYLCFMEKICIKDFYIKYNTIEEQSFLIDLIHGGGDNPDVFYGYMRYPYGYIMKEQNHLVKIPTITFEIFIDLYNDKYVSEDLNDYI